ncbi:hypothetical protein SBDP1_1210017 [Syntrophobacter sp. SbD1]|nr:hypothetical protein SBDP1_1210017 [Syntrophobacter sp. SbD1]
MATLIKFWVGCHADELEIARSRKWVKRRLDPFLFEMHLMEPQGLALKL